MNNANIFGLYYGEVVLSSVVKGKRLRKIKHNNGTNNLFKILIQALYGEDIRSHRPVKLDIYSVTESGEIFKRISTHSIYLSALRYYEEDGKWALYATATILPQDIIDTDDQYIIMALESDILTSSLDANNNELPEILAKINLSTDDFTDLRNGAQLIIDWKLYFDNPPMENDSTFIEGNSSTSQDIEEVNE